MSKPIASVSLDLDNQWSYMKIHGDAGWDSYPTYLDAFVPHVLKVLDDLGLRITFFIVGKDASIDENKPYLQEITRRGHEVGNHSYYHESWLHTYTREELYEEVSRAEEQIAAVTGQRPRGFRGPGFSWSSVLLEVLKEKGYQYDASTLPTYIGPIARMYYFRTAKLSKEERETRKELFGNFRDGLRPVKPYFWKLERGASLLEIPVTTIPVIKTPFHFSYLLYLSGISIALMDAYLNLAIWMCRLTGTQPSYLLHPLDLIGGDQVPQLKFFPGMDISSERKVEVFSRVMMKMKKHFTLACMSEHAEHVRSKGAKMKAIEPGRTSDILDRATTH
ncbi:MAG: polysaccharide deacetylase family protein [Phaeodactylibacter sp.]|nr:polysaccharide deacetylase family protein [Phaeodactylibacter sp.]MCB9274517.1 polysaccharide deacetylase family protein [Lewinellaceae bacterium]